MKKKITATLLLSIIALSNAGNVTLVKANDIDSKISAQDSKINAISEKQAEAQKQVDELQSKVDAIVSEQDKLKAENEKLEAESKTLKEEIEKLSEDIVSRSGVLEKQARSAQTDATATSYINTILDSKSIVDAVSRVNAMREIVSANNRMLEKQKADKEAIAEKQKINQEAINTVEANWKKLEESSQALKTQEAALKVAQLNLEAEKATAESEKTSLLEQKAAAEKAAKEAAEREAAYQAQQAAIAAQQQQQAAAPQQQVAPTAAPTVAAPASNPTVSNTVSAPVATPAPTYTPTRNYSSGGNTYPVGQCTWGVKATATWVGNYWGNANMWPASARAAGFSVGTTPAVGAVIVWPYDGGGYGHVATVIAVNGSNIQVVESNYAGHMTIGNYRGWFTPDSSVSYIYPR